MIEAAREFTASQGFEDEHWNMEFRGSIPAGSETCFFVLGKADEEKIQQWSAYTKQLEEKAIEIAQRHRQPY